MEKVRETSICLLLGFTVALVFLLWPDTAPVAAPPEMQERQVEDLWRHRDTLQRAEALGTPDEQVFYIAMTRSGWDGDRQEIIKFGYSLCPMFDSEDPVAAAYPDVYLMAALSDARQTICRKGDDD